MRRYRLLVPFAGTVIGLAALTGCQPGQASVPTATGSASPQPASESPSVAPSNPNAPSMTPSAPAQPGGPAGSLSAVTFAVAPGTGKGATYYVASTGADTNPGTAEKPFATINHATTMALKPGDVIDVAKGTYTERVTLTGSGSATAGHITLRGHPGTVVRDPEPDGAQNFEIGVVQGKKVSFWLVEGLQVERAEWAGIMFAGSSDVIVANNTVVKPGASGIIAMPTENFNGGEGEVQSHRITVVGNRLEETNSKFVSNKQPDAGSQEALSIWGVDGFEVAGNTIVGSHKEGIDCKTGCRNGSIHHNAVSGTASVEGLKEGFQGGAAIYVDGGRSDVFNIEIHHNEVFDNVADGIAVADETADSGDVKDINIHDNIVRNNGREKINGGHGVVVGQNSTNVSITRNTFFANVQAVVIEKSYGGYPSKNIVITGNILADSSYRNAAIGDVQSVTLTDNVVTTKIATAFEKSGAAVPSLVETGTKRLADPGFKAPPKDLSLRTDAAGASAGPLGLVGAPTQPAIVK